MNNGGPVIRALLSHGTDLCIAGIQGDTILHLAAQHADIPTLRLLSKHHLRGLNNDAVDTSGKTALNVAEERLYLTDEWLAAFNLLLDSTSISEDRFVELLDASEDIGTIREDERRIRGRELRPRRCTRALGGCNGPVRTSTSTSHFLDHFLSGHTLTTPNGNNRRTTTL